MEKRKKLKKQTVGVLCRRPVDKGHQPWSKTVKTGTRVCNWGGRIQKRRTRRERNLGKGNNGESKWVEVEGVAKL